MEGVVYREFREKTGYSIKELAGDAIGRYCRMGLLDDDGERLRLTREGLFVSDAIWPELL
jgi:oxygen-independent coproporphyrinogen-3 oxidase